MDNKITLFFHLGLGKTGTTSIQSYLHKNRSFFARSAQLLYPNIHHDTDFLNNQCQKNHADLFFYSFSEILVKINNYQEYAIENNLTKILFSYENFFYDDNLIRLIKQLSSDPAITIKTIVYLRRQDHILEAAWREWGVKNKKYQNIDEFTRKTTWIKKWLPKIIEFTDIVGKDNFIIRIFDKEQLNNGLIPDFLNCLDIKTSIGEIPDFKPYYRHRAYSSEVTEFIYMNRNILNGSRKYRLNALLNLYLENPIFYKKWALLTSSK